MREDRRKILCIEDDHETAALIAEELVDRGFGVQITCNGMKGYAVILKSPPDLVLCDISMPAASGFDVLERLAAAAVPASPLWRGLKTTMSSWRSPAGVDRRQLFPMKCLITPRFLFEEIARLLMPPPASSHRP